MKTNQVINEPALKPIYQCLRERGLALWDVRDYMTFFSADETSQRYMLGVCDYDALNIYLQRYIRQLTTELTHINNCFNELKHKKLSKGEFE